MKKETYFKWQEQGILQKNIGTIKELTSKNITQKDIAVALNISERVLIKMKKTHPQISNAFIFGNDDLKDNLVSAIYKKAIGFTVEDVVTTMEESKTGQKKKIQKTKKTYVPDFNAARYLLIINFGREYNDKKEELILMEKRVNSKDEEWK